MRDTRITHSSPRCKSTEIYSHRAYFFFLFLFVASLLILFFASQRELSSKFIYHTEECPATTPVNNCQCVFFLFLRIDIISSTKDRKRDEKKKNWREGSNCKNEKFFAFYWLSLWTLNRIRTLRSRHSLHMLSMRTLCMCTSIFINVNEYANCVFNSGQTK